MRLASSGEHRNYAWRTENAYTASDNYTTSNPASIVQIFDQESVATISLFYFFNNDKFTFSRFQVNISNSKRLLVFIFSGSSK